MAFRLLSQLNEKEREYQELLRSSVCRKQDQIDALRTAAAATAGKILNCWSLGDFMVVLDMKAPFNVIFICIVYKRVKHQEFYAPQRKKSALELKESLKSTAV